MEGVAEDASKEVEEPLAGAVRLLWGPSGDSVLDLLLRAPQPGPVTEQPRPHRRQDGRQ